MIESPACSPLSVDVRQWPRLLAAYRDPNITRSVVEILFTIVPLLALWVAMWAALRIGIWLSLPLSIPAAAFLVRLFMIQHDCSHGSFFRQRLTNDWVGRVIGVLTLTPHDAWRRSHGIHHAGIGNLDQRGIGDIMTLTVNEYLQRNRWRRLAYRVYRHPVMLFGIAPAYLFILQHRLPVGFSCDRSWRPWISPMGTNIFIALIAGWLMWVLGVGAFLLIQLPTMLLAASAGVWLFYVQHQFENTYWEPKGGWTHAEAALGGSSYYDLPRPLRWFTANIGIHHVHHLNSHIPFYRLPEVLRHHPELAQAGRITLLQGFACARLALWDERRKRLVSFRQMRQSA